jgi:methylenetetrahydrofolate reductase (NADPH)
MQLYAAGLHFLGYSGIVVAGIENAPEMKTAISKISEALKEFSSFDEWKGAYLNYLARSEMAPYPYRFYAFKDLFKDTYVDVAEENSISLPECSKLEKAKYLIAKKIFSDLQQKSRKTLFPLKKFLAGCVRCKSDYCYLAATQLVCPELCPKRLRNGPCGNTKANGSCELSNKECVHSKIFRMANWRHELDFLEEKYIPK